MPRLTAADFHPEVLRLFDKYVHGQISRRGFLDGAQRYAAGGVTAAGLLAALSPDFANAQQVRAGDPRIQTASVEYPSPNGSGRMCEQYTYPNTQHGFNNDTTPRYDAEAAKLAWSRTVAFFNTHLRG